MDLFEDVRARGPKDFVRSSLWIAEVVGIGQAMLSVEQLCAHAAVVDQHAARKFVEKRTLDSVTVVGHWHVRNALRDACLGVVVCLRRSVGCNLCRCHRR